VKLRGVVQQALFEQAIQNRAQSRGRALGQKTPGKILRQGAARQLH
jgi:hypothetical protein